MRENRSRLAREKRRNRRMNCCEEGSNGMSCTIGNCIKVCCSECVLYVEKENTVRSCKACHQKFQEGISLKYPGTCQKNVVKRKTKTQLRKGIGNLLASVATALTVATSGESLEERYHLEELFAGSGLLTSTAMQMGLGVSAPIENESGYNVYQEKDMKVIEKEVERDDPLLLLTLTWFETFYRIRVVRMEK